MKYASKINVIFYLKGSHFTLLIIWADIWLPAKIWPPARLVIITPIVVAVDKIYLDRVFVLNYAFYEWMAAI